jgi:hypothetical protein
MRAIKITKELLQRFAVYKEEKQDLQATYALLRVPPPQPS